MSLREDPRYPALVADTFIAVGIAEGFLEAEDEDHVLAAWQALHDTGAAYRLQGFFGRTAQSMIADGVLEA